jgi:hypothetical protein
MAEAFLSWLGTHGGPTAILVAGLGYLLLRAWAEIVALHRRIEELHGARLADAKACELARMEDRRELREELKSVADLGEQLERLSQGGTRRIR